MRREAFKFWDLVPLILETLRYITYGWNITPCCGYFALIWACMCQLCPHSLYIVVFCLILIQINFDHIRKSYFTNINTLRPSQNGHHVSDDIFKCIFLNENVWISLKIWRKFVPKVWINNIPALVQIMAWRRPGDKPSSEPMMVSLTTHICVTRPQCVKEIMQLLPCQCRCIFIG